MRLRDLSEKFSNQEPPVQSPRTGVKRPPWLNREFDSRGRSRRGIDDTVDMHGWMRIGQGAYGMAYSNPAYPNNILKVFTMEDIGYVRFYSLAKRSENPHFPEVSYLRYIDYEDPDNDEIYRAYVLMLEKLSPVQTEEQANLAEFLIYLTEGAIDRNGDITPYGRNYYDPARIQFLGDSYGVSIWQIYPQLEEACRLLQGVLKNKTYNNDLHLGNIMFRGNVPVFSDPFTGYYDRQAVKDKKNQQDTKERDLLTKLFSTGFIKDLLK